MGKHSLAGDPTQGYGRYIGRVGALAVALGVGVAVATGYGTGVARADDSTPTDSAPASDTSTETDVDAPEAVDEPTEPTTGEGSDDPDAEDAGDGATGPEMEVNSSGGVDNSVNDEGQSTDDGTADDEEDEETETGDEEDEEAESEEDANEAAHVAPTKPDAAPVNGSAPRVVDTQRTSGTSAVVATLPKATDARTADLDVDSNAQSMTTTTMALSRSVTVDDELHPATFGASQSAVTALTLQPSAQPVDPVTAFSGALINLAATVVAALLSPFMSPGPDAPAEPPLFWAVLAFVRREISRTFFNQTPNAVADPVTTSEDASKTFDVLGNDTDDDDIELTSVTQPAHGDVTINPDGTLTYTPDANFAGTDTFTYTVSDAESPWHLHGFFGFFGGGHSDTATVTVTVTGVNDAPVATNDAATTVEDTPVDIAVLANDRDVDNNTLTPAIVTGPAHGTLTLNANNTYTYTPAADFSGPDSFTYKVNDGVADSNTATVSISVTGVNDPPVFADIDDPAGGPWEIDSVDEDGVVRGHVNVTDPDGDDLTFRAGVVPSSSIGILEVDATTGNWTFTPTPAARLDAEESPGEDGAFFTIVADDGVATAATVVRAPIDATNAVPVASYDGYQTFFGVQVGPDGTIYQAVSTGRQPQDLTKVVVISPTSTQPTVFDLTGSAVGPLTIDPVTGTVYQTLRTADPDTGADTTTVAVIAPGATAPITRTFAGEPDGPGVLGPNGNLYQVTVQPYEPTVVAIAPDGTTVTTAALFGEPVGPVVVSPDGTAYVVLEALDEGNPYQLLGIVRPGALPDYWYSPPSGDDFVGGVVFNDGAVYQTVQSGNTAVVYDIATDAILVSFMGQAQGPVVFGPDGAAYLTTIAASAGTTFAWVTVDRGDGPVTHTVSPLLQGPLVFGPDGTAYLTTQHATAEETIVLEIGEFGFRHFYDGVPVRSVQFAPDGTPYQVTQGVNTNTGQPETLLNVVPDNGDPVILPGTLVGMTFGADGTAYVTTSSVSLGQDFYTVSIVSPDGDVDGIGAFGRAVGAPLVGPDGNVYQMLVGLDSNGNPHTTVVTVTPESEETPSDARFVDLPGALVESTIEDGYVYVTTTTGDGINNTSTVWLLDAQAEPAVV